jgi:hypothetical protein
MYSYLNGVLIFVKISVSLRIFVIMFVHFLKSTIF